MIDKYLSAEFKNETYSNMYENSCKRRRFLFLQGPHGSFFKKLFHKLQELGFPSYCICFNGGDAVDKPFTHNTFYFFKPHEYFSIYLRKIIENKQITDLFLYGDKRYYHTTAIELCKKLKIKIWVFEEGYFRPGYITLEENGVNGSSNIPSIFNDISSEFVSDADSNKVKDITADAENILKCPMKTRIKTTIVNYLGLWFLYPLFPFYKWHRDKGFTAEIFGWFKRKCTDIIVKNADLTLADKLSRFDYFAFPLQLSSDAQIKCASSFRDVSESVEKVIFSFANHANKNDHLVIKLHPLDNSFFNYRKFVNNLSKVFNIESRIHFISNTNSNSFIENSKGTVVINSTMGIISLYNFKPTITLGNAIYANSGLAVSAVSNGIFNEEILNNFWKHPVFPNRQCIEKFFRILRNNAILPGNFYTDEGIEQTIREVLQKISIGGIKNCHILSSGIRRIPNIDVFLSKISRECVIGWGQKKTSFKAMKYASKHNLPYYALEDGFVKSLSQGRWKEQEIIFSLIIDRQGIYYNSAAPSELESIICDTVNSENFEQYSSQGAKLISLITSNNIVKFNVRSSTSENGSSIKIIAKDSSVLLIDQTFGDSSVVLGNASKESFDQMLSDAISKYGPDNVFVKIHPNVINRKAKGYFSLHRLRQSKVHIISSDVNTAQLLKIFKNVYVVTSGTGYEALMAGCHVTCYGEPFYSGYGLTEDKKTSTQIRRIKKLNRPLTIKLLAYAIFYRYSIFIDPVLKKQISPVDSIKIIISMLK